MDVNWTDPDWLGNPATEAPLEGVKIIR